MVSHQHVVKLRFLSMDVVHSQVMLNQHWEEGAPSTLLIFCTSWWINKTKIIMLARCCQHLFWNAVWCCDQVQRNHCSNPTDLRNQSRTPDFMIGKPLTISLAQMGFKCTHQQPKHWRPVNYASGQGVIERQALVALVGVLPVLEGSYTSSRITKDGEVAIWNVCDQLPQSSCRWSVCQSRVACQCTTACGADLHDFTPKFAISDVVIQVLVPVAGDQGRKHI